MSQLMQAKEKGQSHPATPLGMLAQAWGNILGLAIGSTTLI
jgi:hypothetical protein